VTLAACPAFYVGRYVIDNSQVAVMAAFTVIALSAFADFGGPPVKRTTANLVALGVGMVLSAAGTWTSTSTAAATVAMFVVVGVVSFSAVYSGYFAAGVPAVILFYVVAAGIPAPAADIAPRLAGTALGGALAVLASLVVGPLTSADTLRLRLASMLEALRSEVAFVDAPVTDGTGLTSLAGERQAGYQAARSKARELLATRPPRTGGPTRSQRAEMYLLQGADRLAGVMSRLVDQHLSCGPGETLEPFERRLIARLDAAMRTMVDALRGRGPVPDPLELEACVREFRDTSKQWLSGALAAPGHDRALQNRVGRSFMLNELGTAIVAAEVQTRLALGVETPSEGRIVLPIVVSSLSGSPRHDVKKWIRRARGNLTLDSVHLRNSLRLAVGLSIARFLVGVLGLQHGFWVMFATLTVLKTTVNQTGATAARALFGTVIGFAVGAAVVIALGQRTVADDVILPFVFFGSVYVATVGFIAGQALFTLLVLILFNILAPVGWSIGLVRVEDVAVGALVGVAIGVAVWPQGASGQVRQAVSCALLTSSTYALDTARQLLFGEAPRGAADAERQSALTDGVRADDVFAQYLTERPEDEVSTTRWTDLVVGCHMLWYGTDIIRSISPNAGGLGRDRPAVVGKLEEDLERMEQSSRQLCAEIVTGQRPPGDRPVRRGAGTGEDVRIDRESLVRAGDSERLTQVLGMLELRCWADEVREELAHLEEVVAGLDPPSRVMPVSSRRMVLSALGRT
jgi:uncharacterized membrane protein YccC